MATADQIHEKFIKPLEAVLGEPKRAGADPEAIYAALIDDLAQFTPIALEEAMKELRDIVLHRSEIRDMAGRHMKEKKE